jgi:hypothetical protein
MCVSASANMMINGDFEAGSVAWQLNGGSTVYNAADFSIPPSPNGGKWIGNVSNYGGNWNGPNGTFGQDVYGLADGAYLLTFNYYLGARYTDTTRQVGLKVLVNGESVFEKWQNSLNVWTGDFAWQTASIPVNIVGGYANVSFEQYCHFAQWSWTGVDGVNLVAAPEPSSMVALASGLFGLVGFGIRRRK